MRKPLLILLAGLAAVVLLASCGEVDHDAEFCTFLEERGGSTIVELPSGCNTLSAFLILECERSDYAPKVVLSWLRLDPLPEYALDQEVVRTDLRHLGDLVVAFADASGWSNDYYLYVAGGDLITWTFTYDYEEEVLYIPGNYELLCQIVSDFGTLDFEDLASAPGGREFLLENGFARLRHGKLERTLDWSLGFRSEHCAYIDHDGQFVWH